MIVRVAVRRSKSRALRWLSRCLVTTGLAGLGAYFWSVADASWYQASQAVAFKVLEPEPEPVRISPAPLVPVRAGLVPKPRRDPHLLARLEIPKCHIAVLVREGIDSHTLRRAAGHVPGTPLPGDAGNVVIAGHRDTFFRELRHVERGDEILLTTAAHTFRYQVTGLKVVGPDAIEEMASTEERSLTLVTCFPFRYVGPATRRLIVKAILSPES